MSVPSESIDRPRPTAGGVTTRPGARTAAVSTGSRRRQRRITRGEWAAGIILALLAFVGLFPFLFMFVASFKTNTQFYDTYWAPAWPLHLDNYTRAWTQIKPYFLTTVIVAAISIVGTLILATTAGFVSPVTSSQGASSCSR